MSRQGNSSPSSSSSSELPDGQFHIAEQLKAPPADWVESCHKKLKAAYPSKSEQEREALMPELSEVDGKKVLICPENRGGKRCGAETPTYSKAKRHMNSDHDREVLLQGEFPCTHRECVTPNGSSLRFFTQRSSLRTHITAHEKKARGGPAVAAMRERSREELVDELVIEQTKNVVLRHHVTALESELQGLRQTFLQLISMPINRGVLLPFPFPFPFPVPFLEVPTLPPVVSSVATPGSFFVRAADTDELRKRKRKADEQAGPVSGPASPAPSA